MQTKCPNLKRAIASYSGARDFKWQKPQSFIPCRVKHTRASNATSRKWTVERTSSEIIFQKPARLYKTQILWAEYVNLISETQESGACSTTRRSEACQGVLETEESDNPQELHDQRINAAFGCNVYEKDLFTIEIKCTMVFQQRPSLVQWKYPHGAASRNGSEFRWATPCWRTCTYASSCTRIPCIRVNTHREKLQQV